MCPNTRTSNARFETSLENNFNTDMTKNCSMVCTYQMLVLLPNVNTIPSNVIVLPVGVFLRRLKSELLEVSLG